VSYKGDSWQKAKGYNKEYASNYDQIFNKHKGVDMKLTESVVVVCYKGKVDYIVPLGSLSREEAREEINKIIGRLNIKHVNLTYFRANEYFSSMEDTKWTTSISDFKSEFERDNGQQ
jgi:hypothetical protein